jgi:hypothetical protein
MGGSSICAQLLPISLTIPSADIAALGFCLWIRAFVTLLTGAVKYPHE